MSRTLIWVIIVSSALTVYAFGIAPLDEKRSELRDALFIENKSLLKHESFIKSGPGAKEDLKALNETVERMENRLLKQQDLPLAMASLQGRVQDMASEAGFSINSIKPLEPKDHDEGYSSVPIFIDGTGEMPQLSQFLSAIDNRDFMAVTKLSVSIAPMGRLRVKMELAGLMKK